MEPIIEIEGLHKVYDDQKVVKDLNLTIEKGEIFGLLGPNGAGKSTTIRMILGLTEPTQGGVKVCCPLLPRDYYSCFYLELQVVVDF